MSSLGQNLLDFSWEPPAPAPGGGNSAQTQGEAARAAAACTHQAQPVGNADNGFNLIFPL